MGLSYVPLSRDLLKRLFCCQIRSSSICGTIPHPSCGECEGPEKERSGGCEEREKLCTAERQLAFLETGNESRVISMSGRGLYPVCYSASWVNVAKGWF